MHSRLARRLVDAVVGGKGVADRHVGSFDVFVREILPLVVQEHGDIVVQSRVLPHRHVVRFGCVRVGEPSTVEASGLRHAVDPTEARKRQITYAAPVFVDVAHETFDTTVPDRPRRLAHVDHVEVPLFELPVMVGSECCAWRDRGLPESDVPGGGYFIVNGLEKVVVMQETRRVNYPIVRATAKAKATAGAGPGTAWTCELRALNRRKPRSTSTLFVNVKRVAGVDRVSAQIPFVTTTLDVRSLFLMMGLADVDEMRALLRAAFPGRPTAAARDLLDRCVDPASISRTKRDLRTREDVLAFVGTHIQNAPPSAERPRQVAAGRSLAANEFLPHLGLRDTAPTWRRKAEYFAYLVGRLVCVAVGQRPPDDRDDYTLQMFETAGVLIATLVRANFRGFVKTLTTALLGVVESRRPVDLATLLVGGAKRITVGLQYGLRTGNWGPKRGGSPHTGVAQQLAAENPVARWSHMCRAMIQYNRAGKSTQKRHLHASAYGLLDPHETPDGERCLAVDTRVWTPTGWRAIGDFCDGDVVVTVDPETHRTFPTAIHGYFRDVREVMVVSVGDWSIRATLDHRFLCPDGSFKCAADFRPRDKIVMRFGGMSIPRTVKSIRFDGEYVDVADFTTDADTHTFIAERFVTHNCGTIKTLAHGCVVRHIDVEGDPHLRRFLRASDRVRKAPLRLGVRPANEFLVVFNGELVGTTAEPGRFAAELRAARRAGSVSRLASVAVSNAAREVVVDTEAGMCLRPLFVARAAAPETVRRVLESGAGFLGGSALWNECLALGLVEYVSKMEERTLRVADDLASAWRHDISHAEIHPALLLGPAASFMVFPDHDQSPRIAYEGPLSKAALAPPPLEDRMDSSALYLDYAQQPLVSSVAARAYTPLALLPPGINVIVAVLSAGWNQEDALVWNRRFFDLGGFASHAKTTISERVALRAADVDLAPTGTGVLRRAHPARGAGPMSIAEVAAGVPPALQSKLDAGGPRNMFAKPIATVTRTIRRANYDHVDESDGMPFVGDTIRQDDVVIGKVAVSVDPRTDRPCERDASIQYRGLHPARVTRVMRTNLVDGTEFAKVELLQTRRPMVGDKFSSRHAQKGTIGRIVPPEDMPWVARDGTIPDVIMNPHAFPSRMTLGHVLEMLVGKVGALRGDLMDGTAFERRLRTTKAYDDDDADADADGESEAGDGDDESEPTLFELAGRELRRLGYDAYGCERMMCGTTGEMLDASVFVGPIYYQRLRHIALDKIQARLRGPYDHLTHQPVGGRGNMGGQRAGEMEVWTFQAHGAAGFLRDRLVKNSDGAAFAVCQRCQTFATWPRTPGKRLQPECPSCELSETVRSVQMSHAAYLMLREFEAMNVGVKLRIRDDVAAPLDVSDLAPSI